MLTLLILGPKQLTNDIDVYLESLIKDSKTLSHGVKNYGARKQKSFTLKVILLWIINDFPTYFYKGSITIGSL